ncbi:Arylsulfatase precursor [Bremerella volcania]|uniref:Arylsulfatase n=1 Tax=Bremerella volcania TaxID=2527984 RepID=A0A518C902_9BACT|nr:sulfatase [Bremerella volcania]QDU75707.1 Arylsulfatase precursor [Bremerella volcania]
MRLVITALFAMTMVIGLGVPVASAADQPNVVILLSDDQRWDDYSFLGHETIQTPNIDRLASQSLVYERGYVPSSLCRPSLASLFTGLYPHQNGITGNDPRENKRTKEGRAVLVDRFEENPRLADILGKQGYISFQSGKWWEGNFTSGGFTEGMTHGDVTKGGRHGDVGLMIGRKTMQPVIDFIDKAVAEDKPFFLWYAPMMPHLPHDPPKRLLDKYTQEGRPVEIAKYFAMCDWWDETCGQVLDHLDKKKIAENTVVIYLCDNGWIQQADKGGGAVGGPRGKRSVYDGGTRTPIMIRYPGHVKAQRNKTDLASSIDVVPTILDAVGVKTDVDFPGISLLDQAKAGQREAIFGEIYSHDIPDFRKPELGLYYRWIIDGDYKLIVPTGMEEGEYGPQQVALYNVVKDPEEENNVIADHPDVAAKLRKKLDAWWNPTVK